MAKKNKNILLVEDNFQNRKLEKDLLEFADYDVLEAENAEDGIAIAGKNQIDMILMDIQLPGMDGIEAIKIIKSDEKLQKVPCVIVTASAIKEEIKKYRECGCDGYITKPIDTRTFVKEIEQYMTTTESIPKILCVDDERKGLILLEDLLTTYGYEVLTASSGEDALKITGDNSVDLILLDILLPGIDGYEVTRKLKVNEKTRHIPIILITSLKESQDRIKGIKAGCDDFLSKPVDRTELTARVQSLLKVKAYYDHMLTYEKKLESEVEKKTREIWQALIRIEDDSLETIYRLSMAVEYKDEHTGTHIQRMSHYTAQIAGKMGLDKDTIKAIRYASPMHDLGKIGVPDGILLKPGKLDRDEWRKMKQHTVIGAKILEDSKAQYIELARVIALTHHEKWDGSGYPAGLEGENIPVAGQIVAIADVFDALTSERPYKAAFSLEQAFKIIREGKGKHFSPEVTDAFFAVDKEIEKIKEKYK